MKIKFKEPLLLEISDVELESKDFESFMEGIKIAVQNLPMILSMVTSNKEGERFNAV